MCVKRPANVNITFDDHRIAARAAHLFPCQAVLCFPDEMSFIAACLLSAWHQARAMEIQPIPGWENMSPYDQELLAFRNQFNLFQRGIVNEIY
jgi:hypothetical protein